MQRGHLRDCFLAVAGSAHHLKALIGCQHRPCGIHEVRIIVDDENADLLFRNQRSIPLDSLSLTAARTSSEWERVSRWLSRQERELQVRLARELVASCRSLNRIIVELDRELEQRTAELTPALLELPGCGAVTAAKLLAEIGPIERFKSDAQLARHGGVAPLEASSGRVQRHRLDRGGNRQLNAALYRIAITQSRYHPDARAYLQRKQAEGKSRREAIRCLKRTLARIVFNTLKANPALT